MSFIPFRRCTTICDFMLLFWVKPLPHTWHLNGRSPVCTRMCTFRWAADMNSLLQTSQTKDLGNACFRTGWNGSCPAKLSNKSIIYYNKLHLLVHQQSTKTLDLQNLSYISINYFVYKMCCLFNFIYNKCITIIYGLNKGT